MVVVSHLTSRLETTQGADVTLSILLRIREGVAVLLGEALRRSEGHGQLQNLNWLVYTQPLCKVVCLYAAADGSRLLVKVVDRKLCQIGPEVSVKDTHDLATLASKVRSSFFLPVIIANPTVGGVLCVG